MSAIVAASVFGLLAVVHSVLGEHLIVRPYVTRKGGLTGGARSMSDNTLRFTWHAASLAMLAMAAIVLGADPLTVVGVLSLCFGFAMMVMVRGHLAWPLFLAAGLFTFDAADALSDVVLLVLVWLGIAVAGAGGVLHVIWVIRPSAMTIPALPQDPKSGKPLMSPGRLLTALVAGAALTLGALMAVLTWTNNPCWVWAMGVAAALVLAIRVVGDFRCFGMMKREIDTAFAVNDTRYYTPLFVVLLAGIASALVLAGVPEWPW